MAKKLKKTERSNILQIYRLLARHKTALLVSVLVVLLVGGVVAYRASQNSHKFSREDFDYLTTKAEGVLKQVSGEDVTVKRTCSYQSPEEYANIRLYCDISIVMYLPYENDTYTINVAKILEIETKKLGSVQTQSWKQDFFTYPSNNSLTLFINPLSSHPKTQCRFEIATNRFAQKLGIGLPDKSDNNLIALSFYCAAESRGEYFPVTYRQG